MAISSFIGSSCVLLLASFARGADAAAPAAVEISSEDDHLQKVCGHYSSSSEEFGYPLYRLACPEDPSLFCPTRFLYRSGTKGLWSITGSEANVHKNKGTIISTKKGESPVGLTYRYHNEGAWHVDG